MSGDYGHALVFLAVALGSVIVFVALAFHSARHSPKSTCSLLPAISSERLPRLRRTLWIVTGVCLAVPISDLFWYHKFHRRFGGDLECLAVPISDLFWYGGPIGLQGAFLGIIMPVFLLLLPLMRKRIGGVLRNRFSADYDAQFFVWGIWFCGVVARVFVDPYPEEAYGGILTPITVLFYITRFYLFLFLILAAPVLIAFNQLRKLKLEIRQIEKAVCGIVAPLYLCIAFASTHMMLNLKELGWGPVREAFLVLPISGLFGIRSAVTLGFAGVPVIGFPALVALAWLATSKRTKSISMRGMVVLLVVAVALNTQW